MFKIPYDACWMSLFWIPLLCIVCTCCALRKFPMVVRFWTGMFVTVVLFVPGCIGTCYLIEPLYRWQGEEPAEKVPDVFMERPPSTAMNVRFFKDTSHESFTCKISEKEFVEWCEIRGMRLTYPVGPEKYKYTDIAVEKHLLAQYLENSKFFQEDAWADLVYDIRKRADDSGGYEARYSRSLGTMVYEGNYW